MTKDDAEAFGAEVELLAAGLRERLSKDQVAALFLGLLAYDFDEVRQALRRALTECTYFPVPKEIAALIAQNRIDANRALKVAEAEAQQKALPPGPDDAAARAEALAAIRRITASLAGAMAPPPPRRSVADMNAEVARLRATEGKPVTFRVFDGGKAKEGAPTSGERSDADRIANEGALA